MISRKAKRGGVYRFAPPSTLVVPVAYAEALNMSLPEYSWAHGLQLALHALRLAFDNVAGSECITLPEIAQQLDNLRRVHRLTMIPPSLCYLGVLPHAPQHCSCWTNRSIRMETICKL